MTNDTNLIDPWRLALRYNNSPRIRKLYNDMGTIFDNHSLWDFYKFFDSSQALGQWLDRLGTLYNIKRPIGLNGSQFLLDVDMLDDPNIVLDGLSSALADSFYRRIFEIRTRTNLDFASVDTISDLFEDIFGGPEQCRCEIEENFMSFVINLYFADPLEIKTLNTILDMNPNIIGEFPGVSYTVIPHFMYPPV